MTYYKSVGSCRSCNGRGLAVFSRSKPDFETYCIVCNGTGEEFEEVEA